MAFHKIANLIDLDDGCRIAARIGRVSLLLVQENGQTYLFENRCPHMDAPLATGKVQGGAIVCRAHGIAFALDSGKAQGPLGDTIGCLNFFPIAYDGDAVGVDL